MSLQTTNLQTIDFYCAILKTFVVVLLFSASAHAFPAHVVAVSDGDTLTVEPIDGSGRIKIRLHGIDAPEWKQPYGEAARGFVLDVALYKRVEVKPVGKPDRYRRTVAIVYLSGSESLQALLLEAGLAWVWPRYCQNCFAWEALQDAARNEGRGLWAAPDPVPPWEWRRNKRSANKRWHLGECALMKYSQNFLFVFRYNAINP